MAVNYFECCMHCVTPKRHPGCHGTCSEYKEAHNKYNEDRAKSRLEKKIQSYTNTAICTKRNERAKYLKGNRRYTRRG